MSDPKPCKEILRRYEGNPIITPKDFPGAHAIYNCGAVKFEGQYLLLLSITDCNSDARMHVATSDDGINFDIRKEPLIETSTDPEFKEYDGWTIDPRITKIGDTYYIVYPAYSVHGVVGMLGKTLDFKTFERIDIISLPDNRCPVLFPEKINGEYVRLDRPTTIHRNGEIWISYSPDLIHWGHHRLLLEPGSRPDDWNSVKVGPCGPPIKTDKGWLMIYHGVHPTGYSLSCALLDLRDPSTVIGKMPGYMLTAEEPYEMVGRVRNVVFSTGAILEEETGELKLYYGAADTCIGLATAPLDELVEACLRR
ncbi:MAG: glycosidase [Thermoplasmata archaeon]|nr:MAG: glycosidase [Thermoplasmata archaeon]